MIGGTPPNWAWAAPVGSGDAGPAPLRYFLAVFYLLAAIGTARMARRRWYELPRPEALTPIAYWPYSAQRWQNLMRAYAWGGCCVSCVLMTVAVASAFPKAEWVVDPLALIDVASALLFLVLIAFGRPKRLLSPHF